MEYQKDTPMSEKHHWKNERVSFYAEKVHGSWEIEFALYNREGSDMFTYRLANTASLQKAAEIIANLLEVFDLN